jgi:hypothetical protein
MGGESQKASLNQVTGYSTYAHCIGKPSYLEPNSGSLQKPIEGVYAKNSNKPQKTRQPKTTKTVNGHKKETRVAWVVGLGDNLRGRRESVLK